MNEYIVQVEIILLTLYILLSNNSLHKLIRKNDEKRRHDSEVLSKFWEQLTLRVGRIEDTVYKGSTEITVPGSIPRDLYGLQLDGVDRDGDLITWVDNKEVRQRAHTHGTGTVHLNRLKECNMREGEFEDTDVTVGSFVQYGSN